MPRLVYERLVGNRTSENKNRGLQPSGSRVSEGESYGFQRDDMSDSSSSANVETLKREYKIPAGSTTTKIEGMDERKKNILDSVFKTPARGRTLLEGNSGQKRRIPLRTVEGGRVFKTYIPPTLHTAVKKTPKRAIPLKMVEGRGSTDVNKPSLTHLLPVYFTESRIPYATSVIHHLQNKDIIQWDNEGNLHSPLVGRNIFHLIQDFAGRKKVEVEKVPDYSYIIRVGDIPNWLIKNKLLVGQVNHSRHVQKGAGGGGKARKKRMERGKHATIAWVAY